MKTKNKKVVYEGVHMEPIKKTFIYTTFQKEGYHTFPEAATLPNFATGEDDLMDVSHLANKHMHYFKFRVWVQVSHANRDIEFIQLRRWLEDRFESGPYDFGNNSCEMIAEGMATGLLEAYPTSEIRVEVAEDEINGAIVELTPTKES